MVVNAVVDYPGGLALRAVLDSTIVATGVAVVGATEPARQNDGGRFADIFDVLAP